MLLVSDAIQENERYLIIGFFVWDALRCDVLLAAVEIDLREGDT